MPELVMCKVQTEDNLYLPSEFYTLNQTFVLLVNVCLLGPTELHSVPATTTHMYGWWMKEDALRTQPWTHTERRPHVNSEMTRYITIPCVCILFYSIYTLFLMWCVTNLVDGLSSNLMNILPRVCCTASFTIAFCEI